MNYELFPPRLPWSAVDPHVNSFAWDDEESSRTTALIASLMPCPITDRDAKHHFTTEVTALLAARYGRWACGWDWAVGEGGGGGVVASWCCSSHSVGEPAATARAVVASLLQWRDWLEELAEQFARLAPPVGADAEDRSWYLERAACRLVTVVIDRTNTECVWYGLCHTVLTWFLSFAGMEEEAAKKAVGAAIGGRFKSWVEPSRALVDAVGEDLAVGLTGTHPYRDY
ncbi:hypothetical protein [Streptomyces sp. H39-S7]|uniref:hypothetical protein n=1 Tax=Streptomyces sp. H39-S7 TaxID=3004357 RepID=UPI0022AF7DDA|nr:hypothetical protein [Streptomyces sp. H39-S7]MCZ4119831.1 hypothetical protein [Streptomyces sp. H39-S7]